MATNDPHGVPQPTGGSTDASIARAGDDHAGPTAHVDPSSLQAGHEPDKVDVKGILIVPAVVVVTGVLAYIVVTLIIGSFRKPDPVARARANPMAAQRNDAGINERFGRIDSTDPNAEIEQPRLEGLRRMPGEEPPYLRSRLPLPPSEGNSPEFHPEDLRAERVEALNKAEWIDQKKGVARIPIDRAMELAVKGFKVQDKAAVGSTAGKPRSSNSGRGLPSQGELRPGQEHGKTDAPAPKGGHDEHKDKGAKKSEPAKKVKKETAPAKDAKTDGGEGKK